MAKYTIRDGKREDCKEIRRLIQELADFEKMPNGPKIGAQELERDGFDIQPPLYNSFVAERADNPGVLVGYAICYDIYSGLTGRKLYLEDLYVTEEHRKQGLGLELIRKVIERGVKTNCYDMECFVLEWNPAKNFYVKLGAADESTKQGIRLFRIRRPEMDAFLASK